MKGTHVFCRTNEAVKRMQDGDIIQNLTNEQYFKQHDSLIYVSKDCFRWEKYEQPMESFPPYEEWKSLSDLHYYSDLVSTKEIDTTHLKYLTLDDRKLSFGDVEADLTKKRWFIEEDML